MDHCYLAYYAGRVLAFDLQLTMRSTRKEKPESETSASSVLHRIGCGQFDRFWHCGGGSADGSSNAAVVDASGWISLSWNRTTNGSGGRWQDGNVHGFRSIPSLFLFRRLIYYSTGSSQCSFSCTLATGLEKFISSNCLFFFDDCLH